MRAQLWILALRRGAEVSARSDWRQTVRKWPGVRVVGASDRRMQIEAIEPVVEKLGAALGPEFLIEKTIAHHSGREPA